MPPIVDHSCPACGSECADNDLYCWSCGAELPVHPGQSEVRRALVVGAADSESGRDSERRLSAIALVVLLTVAAGGFWQLGRDRGANAAGAPIPLESVLAAEDSSGFATGAGSVPDSASRSGSGADSSSGSRVGTAAGSDGATPAGPTIRIDPAVLADSLLGTGYLVFADASRTHMEVVDLATGTVTSRQGGTAIPGESRLRSVSDLGLIVETAGAINRWNWNGSVKALGDADLYLGGNTLTILQVPTGVPDVVMEFTDGERDWSSFVRSSTPFFIVGDAAFTQSDTSILRAGQGTPDWETIGQGVIATVMNGGVLAFDCITGDPALADPCLMDIYRSDGSRVVSSRTASQLRWNVTAGGRNDAGLSLSHNGEMLAEPTQVGLGVWNTSGGTLRRISGVPLEALQWTHDDRAVVGLGPSVDGWAPIMELDISRGTTLPVGIEVHGLDLIGLADSQVTS